MTIFKITATCANEDRLRSDQHVPTVTTVSRSLTTLRSSSDQRKQVSVTTRDHVILGHSILVVTIVTTRDHPLDQGVPTRDHFFVDLAQDPSDNTPPGGRRPRGGHGWVDTVNNDLEDALLKINN